ncbi:transposase [Vibrio sinus]|uniref:transposase n=1 Tax=Vibrio sinus TaxID=2946865 RepID=UPI003D7006C0
MLRHTQRPRFWLVHFVRKTQHPNSTINYLGPYLKRPPISGAKLAYYLDHHTERYEVEHVTHLSCLSGSPNTSELLHYTLRN